MTNEPATPPVQIPLKAERDSAWESAIHLYGTAAIFRERARHIKWQLTALKVLGILLPVLIGGLVLSFGAKWSSLDYAIYAAGFIGLVQLIWTVLAVALNYDDRYATSKESEIHCTRLSDQYKRLGEKTWKESESTELNRDLELLSIEKRLRDENDLRANVSDHEIRMGLRSALQQFDRPCGKCNKVPNTRQPSTTCAVCGI